MILFHRSAAASWGHVAFIIKRSSTGDSLFFGSTPTTVSMRSIVAAPWRHTFGTFHHWDQRAMNARAEFKGTGHTELSSSRHFICNYFTHFKTYLLKRPTPTTLPTTLPPTLPILPSNTFTYLPYNLHNKPYFILYLELFLELSFMNCYLHIRCLFHLV